MNTALIVLDTVRKDYFDRYADTLNRMADETFERAYVPSTWTSPSHASMATGKLPHQHGVDLYRGDMSHLKGGTFIEELSNQTLCVSSNINLNIRGFTDFFDIYDDPLFQGIALVDSDLHITDFLKKYQGDHKYIGFVLEALKKRTLLRCMINGTHEKIYNITGEMPPLKRRVDYGTKRTISTAQELLPEQDFFLFMNLMEAHAPHRPVTSYDSSLLENVPNSWSSRNVDFVDINENPRKYEKYLQRFKSVYSASIDYLDRVLPEFIEELVGNDTTVIVTSDHGENLGYPAEGAIAHSVAKGSDSLAHVPLLVFNPPGTVNTDGLVSLRDIGELIRAFERGETVDITKERVGFERAGVNAENRTEKWRGPERGVYTDTKRWVWDTETCLMQDLPIDLYDEEVGTETQRPSDTPFEGSIEDYVQEAKGEASPVDTEAVAERLETLGYK